MGAAETPLAGRFQLQEAIGTGGMGIVYRARDLEAERIVAVKLLHPTDAAGQERFEREAAALASLTHEAIVRYERHGRSSDGQLYLVTEWLDGQSLADAIDKRALSLTAIVAIGRRIARALAAAHARGIVHRDVKPSNVLLPHGRPEQATLIDFGIARGGALSRTTKTGIVLGTPGYMAPEQVRGDAHVDGRSDLFSLGCVLYEAISGAPPFDGEHLMAILAKILLEPSPPLRALRGGVTAELDALVLQLLAKSPEHRPASAEAVADALDAITIDPAEDVPRSAPAPASLAAEQRIVSVIVITDADRQRAAARGPVEAARSLETSTLQMDVELHSLVASFDGALEILADGSQIVVFSGARSATDQAALAVRCALAIRRVAPLQARVTLATGRGRRSARWPVGEAIDRAVLLARSDAAGGAVWLDDVTAGLLDARFEVDGERGALRVVREVRDAEQVRVRGRGAARRAA